MSAVDTLDEALLASYLEANIDEFKGPLTASKFAGGQSNPTFKIDAASGSYVLRRQPPGKLLKSAHAVDREYRVLAALADTDVPVAKVYHLCEDPQVIGSMFYIMEFCEGNVYWESSLEQISSNQQRTKMYDEMCRVMAAIHSVDLEKVGLSDYGRPGNYFQRQYDRWSAQYKASELKPIPEMDQVIEWLGKNIPEDDGRVSLVHGDYRLDNLMFSSDNERVIAVLDWELSTLGHPFADLAYQCMGMRLPSGNGPGASSGLLGVDVQAVGIPSEQDYIDSYCQRMGIDKLDNWNFYLAFSFFRLAAIAQGVAKRAADGNASSKQAGGVANMVKPISVNALAIINEH
ncbi:phosphotransferase family protein [Porticoccaceae bacterium]|nr:phosphotransferase family protein [Porticoccaceae bacterium]MDB2594380.1 phosphotransferase family protein [Porticoccaceae bacterium]MDB3966494.1 phosphotransferase family protein [Porticoccaceae bacterium]